MRLVLPSTVIAAHLLYPQIVDDNNPTEREIGTMYGLALPALCDEVWCFGKTLSAAMEQEIKEWLNSLGYQITEQGKYSGQYRLTTSYCRDIIVLAIACIFERKAKNENCNYRKR